MKLFAKFLLLSLICVVLSVHMFVPFYWAGNEAGAGGGAYDPDKPNPNAFIRDGVQEGGLDIAPKIAPTSALITNILIAAGTFVAVIVALLLGIKWIMGSIASKAEASESLKPYFIGLAMVAAAFTIFKIAVNLFQEITKNPIL